MKWLCPLSILVGLTLVAAQPGCGPVPDGDPSGPLLLDASSPGLISSPGFNFSYPADSLYPNNIRCDWIITMQDSSQPDLELTFFNFSVEDCNDCKCDFVSVYLGDTPDPANLTGTYCNDPADPNFMPPDLATTSRSIYVQFVTDSSTQFMGFLARYGYPFTSSACDGGGPQVITEPSGIFQTQDYPVDYPNNMVCEWLFTAPQGQRIEISFSSFDTENCCSCDYLLVYDGGDNLAPFKGRYYGSMRPARMTSSDNSLYMIFTTDASVRTSGFIGAYRFI